MPDNEHDSDVVCRGTAAFSNDVRERGFAKFVDDRLIISELWFASP